MSCQICLEDYSKKLVQITCQHCPTNACRGCLQRYLLQSYEDPHCVSCKRGWSTEFMAANFPLSFRNDALRKHRRKILFEREKSILPTMQVFVEYRRNITESEDKMNAIRKTFGDPFARPKTQEALEIHNKSLSVRWMKLRDERVRIQSRLASVKSQIIDILKGALSTAKTQLTVEKPEGFTEEEALERRSKILLTSELGKFREERDLLKENLERITVPWNLLSAEYKPQREALNIATSKYWENRRLYEGTTTTERREFIMKCADETCRGFLSSSYKCGTCSKWTCSQCLVIIGENKDDSHTCDPNTVETAKTIKSETRPCPKCATRIFKLDGCDQMWCVMEGCNTAFSWDTGHVVTGAIHNPHYYEWLRRTGGGAPARELGDIPCGGLPGIHQIFLALRSHYIPSEIKHIILETHRNIRELVDIRLRDYPARQEALANKDTDVLYLMKMISEAEWQRQLELSEAKFNRKKEIGQILQTLATAGSDLMNHIVNQAEIMEHDIYATWISTSAIEQLEQLRIFGNESLKNLGKRDRMAIPQFEDLWKWKGIRALYKPVKKSTEVIT